ncbi:MAG: hydratase [Epulopiscium sp. Nele67-Bin004]|nr:MAG: hydratase [Epulopiscium sp. Nele67-Bin004]
MIKIYDTGVFLVDGTKIVDTPQNLSIEDGRKGTITYDILQSHNTSGDTEKLQIKFDAMTSHDITFVGIIQTAKASGLKKFPIPYVLTNCHNSLCAVGGTINEDDHMFGLSAAKKYGGIYVPPHIAVIHQYMREMVAGCGKMIIGSDSHTRYGALGTMAIGEGGGELVKQLLCDTYDINYPDVVAIYLDGKPRDGVGPQDIALAIIGKVFDSGFVKNKVMEFVGPGVAQLETDFRNGIDVMTTETTCLSSIWQTDEDTHTFLKAHGRGDEYKKLAPKDVAYYDGMVYVDMDQVKPMIALPFHPSNVYEIEYLNNNLEEVLTKVEEESKQLFNGKIEVNLLDKIVDGKLKVDQGIIAGCAGGTYSNIMEGAKLMSGSNCGNGEFSLSVYPSSQPVMIALTQNGALTDYMSAGAIVRSAFCGPCFGAGDTPSNGALSIRHTTRNFPNREGANPSKGQITSVALMDARSIAATAANGGFLTAATDTPFTATNYSDYKFDPTVYNNRVYNGFDKADETAELKYGPNIKDWPQMSHLTNNILMKVVSFITDAVTTTDELIPSGETSSYRSNPLGLAEFTLSRRDPEYVGRAKEFNKLEKARTQGDDPTNISEELCEVFNKIKAITPDINPLDTGLGSVVYANKPGDGSAREQAASCQRVLGGIANIATEYATKRYRSNLMNWGMVPFLTDESEKFGLNDYIYVPNILSTLQNGDMSDITAYIIGNEIKEIKLYISEMTDNEKQIVCVGSLINYNKTKLV